jgi:transcriptional regulator with XRE-family HTH domain
MNLPEIGLLLREACRRVQRMQGELAQALGMSRATLSARESGRCKSVAARGHTQLSAFISHIPHIVDVISR